MDISRHTIKMTKDYLLGKDSIFTNYEDNAKHSEMFVLISKVTDSSTGTIEKDDRPVIEYTKENTTWYIMHNLQQINAVALTENYQVLISAPVSVDEMKEIIDSINDRYSHVYIVRSNNREKYAQERRNVYFW